MRLSFQQPFGGQLCLSLLAVIFPFGALFCQPEKAPVSPEKHLKNIRQVTFGGDNAEAYWSPDSKWLTFQSNNPKWGLKCDQIFAMKVKDAIVDQFRDKFGVRPDVEKHGADLVIQVRAVKNQFSLSVDLSGESLFKRGYRKEALEAPLKENLAAGLLRLAEWDRITPIVDPMCGSGTILIEAAMMALNMAPGSHRKNFGFQNWLNFDEEAWEKVLDEAAETEKQDLDFKLFGFDIDRKAISIAKANAKVAGVDHVVEFKSEPVATLNPPVPEGMIVTNPPYGARIGDEDNLRDVYRDLSYTLKNRFPGWTAWILAGNKDLVSDLKLKSTRKFQVFNGNIECRLLKYEIQQR